MPGGDKRRERQINKRLGRTQTIKNTNKHGGKGTDKTKKRNTICNKWGCKPKRKTKVRSNTSKPKSNKGSKEESSKISGLEITVSKDEKQNKGLSKILSGGKALPKLRAKLPSIKLGRRDKSLNIDEESNWGQHLDDSFSA